MTHEQRLTAARAFRRNVLDERDRLRTEAAAVATDLSAVANALSALTAVWTLLPLALRERLGNYITHKEETWQNMTHS